MRIINNQPLPTIINSMPEITSCGRGVASPDKKPAFEMGTWSLLQFNYKGKIQLENEMFEYKPGYAFLTSPHVFKHHFPDESSYHLFVQMTFQEKSLANKTYILIDLAESYQEILRQMHELIIYHQADKLRAQVSLWNIMQKLKDCGLPGTKAEPKQLLKALEYIEANLHKTIEINELVDLCKVSQSYLTRLFHKYRGQTIIGYLRKRRLELAHAMLISSTRPIKEIAAAVGIPDLHYFNKCIKQEYSSSPRKLRNTLNSVNKP